MWKRTPEKKLYLQHADFQKIATDPKKLQKMAKNKML